MSVNIQTNNDTVTVNVTDDVENITVNLSEGILSETDPIFTSSPAYTITNTDITNWNNSIPTIWGNITGDINTQTDLISLIPTKTSELNNDLGFITNSSVYRLFQPNGTNPFVYTDNSGQLHIDGNIIQNGSSYKTHAEQLYTKNDIIITRDGATAGLSNGSYTGIQAKLYDGVNDGQLVFDNNGIAKVGDVGSLQPLATREETPTSNGFAYWDSTNLKFLTKTLSSSDVGLSNVTNNAQVVSVSAGTGLNSSGGTTPTISIGSGYYMPTTTDQTNWNTAYSNRITSASSPLSISSNTLSISQAATSTNGYLSSTDWNTFNNKQSALSLTSGYVPYATGTSTLTNSPIYTNGTNVGINNSSPSAKLDILDTSLSGSGSLSGSILNLAQTWNTTGSPTAIKLNVTNTASGNSSKLIDLQIGGISKFYVDNTGNISIGNAGNTHRININDTENQTTSYGISVNKNALVLQQDIASTGNDEALINKYYAWPFIASGNHTVGSISVRLKTIGTVTNTTDYIRLNLYSDNSGNIGTLLGTSDIVRIGSLTNSYVEKLFGLSNTLVSGTTYWIVMERSASITGGGSINLDRGKIQLTTSTDGINWTYYTGLGRYIIYGRSSFGIYGYSTNSNGVVGYSTNSSGVVGSSTNSFGVYGSSTNSSGVYGASTNSFGVVGASTNSFGVVGTSTNSNGVVGYSTNSSGARFHIGDGSSKLTQNNSLYVTLINRRVDGNSAYSVTGDLLQITDNPTNVTSRTGALINGTVDTTSRLRFDPYSTTLGGYWDSPYLASGKLWSWRVNGTEIGAIDYTGNITKGPELSKVSGTVFTQIANKTVANTTTETTIFGTGSGSLTLPANTFTVGKTVRCKFKGYTSGLNGTSATINIKIGGTTICTSTSNLPAALSNTYWELEFDITCRTTGTTGMIIGQGKTTVAEGTGFATVTIRPLQMTSTATVNTTISNTIDCTYTWGTASTSNTITSTNATIEILN